MRPVSARYLQAIGLPHKQVAEVTVTLPGETEGTLVDIEADDCTVTMTGTGGGERYGASISLSPNLTDDVYELAATPGASFTIRSGIDFGAGQVQWVDCGVLYATGGTRALALGSMPLTLTDGTTRLVECRFPEPWSISGATLRGDASAAIVADAWPDVVIRQLVGGPVMGDAVYDRDRLAALNDISAGGSLDAAFDAAGAWLIRNQPLITPGVPVWIAATGETGTILEGAERTIPFAELFNSVIVGAPEQFQTWGAVTVSIADPDHPRHSSKIGVRPFWVPDSMTATLTSRAQALALGRSILTRLLTTVEEIKLPSIGNPALEFGDTIAVVHQATEVDPGLGANYYVEGWSFNLGTSAQDITGRSTDQPALEEG